MSQLTPQQIEEIISLAEQANQTNDKEPLRTYVDSLSPDQQAELIGLMSYGRNDAVDGPIPLAEHVEHAKRDLDAAGQYLASKRSVLGGYLRNALRLRQERHE